jgi:hypothetical protein
MASPRVLNPRLLRPNLSSRYQWLQRRAESNAARQARQPPPSFLRRNRVTIALGVLSLAVGTVGGQFVVHTLSPPPLPEAGSREDGILLADLNRQIDENFRVKVLRGKCLGVAKQLKGEEGGWFEVIPLPLEINEKTKSKDNLIAGMQGAGGLGVERIFWDKREQKLVAVVWFGGSLCGWPGVTHGGALATEMAEKLSLTAALADNGGGEVLERIPGTGNHAKMLAPAKVPDEPAQLSIGYLKPSYANQFYVIRVAPAIPENKDSVLTPEPYGGADYEAIMETLDGKPCVKARAKFKPSTAMQRTQGKAANSATSSYENFKEWMWPSRQKNSQLS